MGVLNLIKTIAVPLLYCTGIVTCIVSAYKRPEWGLFLMIALIPQPNIFYKLYEYPMGKEFINFIFISVLIGMFICQKGFLKTGNSVLLILVIAVSYLALWNSSMRFSLGMPLTMDNVFIKDWKNYAEMVCMYFLVVNIVKTEDQVQQLVVLMSVVVLFISFRSYQGFTAGSAFSEDASRAEGPFWRVGLGSNHFGAFIAEYCAVFLGLLLCDKNKWRRLLCLATVVVSLHPLFFCYSRGAYLAAFGVLVCFGVMKKRTLLVLAVVIVVAWQTVLPASVVDRIEMTRTESESLSAPLKHGCSFGTMR